MRAIVVELTYCLGILLIIDYQRFANRDLFNCIYLLVKIDSICFFANRVTLSFRGIIFQNLLMLMSSRRGICIEKKLDECACFF